MSVRGCLRRLQAWREKYEASPPTDEAGWQAAVDEAVTTVAPLVVTALVGVASGKEGLRDQRSLVDDILHVQPWNRAGDWRIIDLPQTLAFVYQGLHGATALYTKQLRLAIDLADMQVRWPGTGEYHRLWRSPQLVARARTVGGVSESWVCLSQAFSRWEWVRGLFASDVDYRVSLVSYYMALNVHELAVLIAEQQRSILDGRRIRFEVPLCFFTEGQDITDRAVDRLIRSRPDLDDLWERHHVSAADVKRSWPRWIEHCGKELSERWELVGFPLSAYRGLFDLLD